MHEDPEDHNRLLLSFFSKGVGMFAAIDLGSNSFRLHIGEYVNGIVCVVKSAREPNRLAAGLDRNNVLSREAMDRGLDALKRLLRHSGCLSSFGGQGRRHEYAPYRFQCTGFSE